MDIPGISHLLFTCQAKKKERNNGKRKDRCGGKERDRKYRGRDFRIFYGRGKLWTKNIRAERERERERERVHELEGGEVRSISLRVRARTEDLDKPSTPFEFEAQATDMESLRIVHESRFVKPL